MPSPITFRHIHVVHVDGNPYISGGVGYLVIDMWVDEEVVGAGVAILDIVHSRLADGGEIELHIVVLEIGSPRLDVAAICLRSRAVIIDFHKSSILAGGGILVQFYDCDFRLVGHVSHLGETDVGFPDPSRNGMGFERPGHHLSCLAFGQDRTEDEPAILCQHTSVVEAEFTVFGRDADETLRVIGGEGDLVTHFEGQGVNKPVCSAVIISLEALELTRFLAVGAGGGETCCITWKSPQTSVHLVGLEPVLGGQELDVETCIASKDFWHRLVQPYRNFHRFPFGCDHYPRVEVVVVIPHADLDALGFFVDLA